MRRALLVLVAGAALLAAPATAGASAEPGPRLHDPEVERLDALVCSGSLAYSPQIPVLLVHGTGVTAEENWSFGYLPALLDAGHSVCTVQLPNRGYGDVQRSLEYVVTAIREMHRRAGRWISIIGHSQGAVLPPIALRLWPDLAPMVDDVIGLSGVYAGEMEHLCPRTCVPAFWQLEGGSHFWAAVLRHPLPAGPSYTAIGTLYDEIVNPQPQANALPPGPDRRSMLIQDLCPGRQVPHGYNHIFMAGDAIAYDLASDALDHPGPADPSRISRLECLKLTFGGIDYLKLVSVLPGLLSTPAGAEVQDEPPLRCYLVVGCPLLRAVALAPATMTLRARADDNGQMRVLIERRAGRRRVRGDERGPFAVWAGENVIPLGCGRGPDMSRCRRLRPGDYAVLVETRHLAGDPWTPERTLRLVLASSSRRRHSRGRQWPGHIGALDGETSRS